MLKINILLLGLALPAYSFGALSLQELIAESKKIHLTCPAAKDLKLNTKTKTWTALGGWKTYTPSFGTQIQSFLGAQWNGVQLGQVICIYRAKDAFTFPIKLFFNHQVIAPDHGKWKKVKSNVINCYGNRKLCAFSPLLSPKSSDPLQEALDLKSKPKNVLPEQNL